MNLLAKGWRIPSAYVRDAVAALRKYDQWVELTVASNGYPGSPLPSRRPNPGQPGNPGPTTRENALPKPTCRFAR